MKFQFAWAVQAFVLGVLVHFTSVSFGQESDNAAKLEGIWKWTFTMPDGSQVMPRLELKLMEDGELAGSTRIRAGTETPITNLTVHGNEVSFQVTRERDGREVVTRYAGILNSNTIHGKMVSNWNGEDQTYDWDARRLAGVGGVWKWSVAFGGGGFRAESALTLKQEGERLTGKLTTTRAGESEIKKGRFKNGHISFETERERDGETFTNRYSGKLSGDKILGHMELNFFGQPRTNKWEATRVD